MSLQSLFPQQLAIQKQFSEVKNLFIENKLSTENLDNLKPLIDNFEIRVPFIGGFSSGKSTIINTLMGLHGKHRLLSTNVKPETAVAAEIHYGENLSIKACYPDGNSIAVSEENFKNSDFVNSLNLVEKEGWFEIYYPVPVLQNASHLILVDMPGWGSAVDNHKKVVDDYANRSLAYVVVVSVNEGTLHNKLKVALSELGINGKSIVLAISKAHLKLPKDAEAVRDVVAGELEKVLQYPPKAVVTTSAGTKDVAQLETALINLEKDAKNIFSEQVGAIWISELNQAKTSLEKLTNEKFKDAESIQAEIDNFAAQMKKFTTHLENAESKLENEFRFTIDSIRRNLERAMESGLHGWSERALNKNDISHDILDTTRNVVAESINREFMPIVSKYVNNVVAGLPEDFDSGLSSTVGQVDLSNIRINTSISNSDKVKGGLLGTLATVLLAVPHPLAKIGGAVLGLLAGNLFSGPSDAEIKAQQAEARAEAINRAKSELKNALDKTVQEAMLSIEPSLKNTIEEAKAKTKLEINKQKANIEIQLNKALQALQEGEEKAKAVREKAKSDIEKITMCINEVTANN